MGLVQRIAATSWFAKVAPHVVPRLDRALHRLTGGRYPTKGGPVPRLMLHAIGARSGEPRDVPLAAVPDGDSGAFYVVGSNFGREAHPVWTANLLAHPDVAVTFDACRIDVRARLLDADEKRAVWPRLTAAWPPFDRYVERSGRDLRVFRLEPRGVTSR